MTGADDICFASACVLLDLYRRKSLSPVEATEALLNHAEAMQPVLTRAQKGLENELASVTVADIASEVARLGKFSIPLTW